jgi:signal transduction histidine kinase
VNATSLPGLPPHADGARVLIVEDDPSSARVLRSILEQAGYRVALAADGPAALRLVDEEGAPDLVLLDWMLPGMSGLEVCHQLRLRWDALQLPILIVTAKTDPESAYAAFDAGASDYVAKPFRGAEIRARLGAHLRTKRLVEDRARVEEHLREREKLSSLGLLASGVAHDLNSPLAVIHGYAQMMRKDAADPRAAERLGAIVDAVDRCRKIVGDLLSFARGRPSRRGPVALGDVLRATLDLRAGELEGRGIAWTLDVDPGLPEVSADGHQLQQVFLNILLNAEQALHDAGSTVRVRAAPAPDPLASGLGAGVEVSFWNDGPAIPPEVVPHIFEPFFTTKTEDQGTGLGLAISMRIVREHGGEIGVESGAEGTTFTVRLPLVDAEAFAG